MDNFWTTTFIQWITLSIVLNNRAQDLFHFDKFIPYINTTCREKKLLSLHISIDRIICLLCASVAEKKKCPNNKKEIYNDKYKHTRDSLFGLHESMSINRLNIVTLQQSTVTNIWVYIEENIHLNYSYIYILLIRQIPLKSK